MKKFSSKKITLLLLYFGYFLDFYDLSVFAISYNEVLKEHFHIISPLIIQQTRIMMTNYQIFGILLGCLIFGFFGDRLGRVFAIRYSILIYSFSTLMAVFTTSIPLFTFFRFLSGFGLACEFSTSNVLIAELLKQEDQVKASSQLYLFGIFGGLFATLFGFFSWKFMFLFGGFAGFVLFLFRENLIESDIFKLFNSKDQMTFKNIFSKMFNFNILVKLFYLTILIMPFNFVISVFFLLPKFMKIHYPLEISTKIILFTFYIGNLISTFAAMKFVNKFKNYKIYLIINIFIFLILIPLHTYINDYTIFLFGIGLGILGGGYPTIWMQFALRYFPTSIRNTSSNLLFSFGRMTSILFNFIFLKWLSSHDYFSGHIVILVILISVLCFCLLIKMKDTYGSDLVF